MEDTFTMALWAAMTLGFGVHALHMVLSHCMLQHAQVLFPDVCITMVCGCMPRTLFLMSSSSAAWMSAMLPVVSCAIGGYKRNTQY